MRYCRKGKCPGRMPRECPRGWREVYTRKGLYCQRGEKRLTWDAAWEAREAREAKRGGLGAAEDVHRHRMEEDFKIAQNYIRMTKEAAKARDCWQVWENLMVVRARVSDYYAHMESLPGSATTAEWNRHAKLGAELHKLQESLGWQCVRKIK